MTAPERKREISNFLTHAAHATYVCGCQNTGGSQHSGVYVVGSKRSSRPDRDRELEGKSAFQMKRREFFPRNDCVLLPAWQGAVLGTGSGNQHLNPRAVSPEVESSTFLGRFLDSARSQTSEPWGKIVRYEKYFQRPLRWEKSLRTRETLLHGNAGQGFS